MTDKWTIRSNNEGLYNGVKPPEEKGTRKKERTRRKSYCSIWKNTTWRKTFHLRTYPSDTIGSNQFIQNLLLGPEIIICLCVLVSSAKFLTFSNCYKTLLLAQFFRLLSYKFIVLGLLGPSPVSTWVWATICDPTMTFTKTINSNIKNKMK